ncbi:putative odorant receptor 92a [Odontomachus brunneus]|uniref:putative odorant receptor 92a n=1 Tax=Odontomachus brunneus TaxID=486640 RepID=UPI0013F18601|nr:putative odorant receptor 92a [Odontomachus brunneus]
MDCLGLALANSLATLKLFAMRWNRRIFHYVLSAINKDWNECIKYEISRSIMMRAANQSRRCSYLLIGIHAMAGFALSIGAYMFRSVNTDVRELPVKMEFSFDFTKSPLFECILVVQFLYILTIASIVGMINALLASLVLHVGGQIDIMRHDLLQIPVDNDPRISLAVIRNLVLRHRKIIILADNIETVFTVIALMQLLWNTLIICCSGLMIVISLSIKKGMTALVKSMLLYVAKTIEVFVFCYAGEFLSAKSKSISDAVYESLWYDMLPSNSRVLLFIIVRSQKRLTITAGKIVDLTLDGFMSVMKASASYMSVLHAMY